MGLGGCAKFEMNVVHLFIVQYLVTTLTCKIMPVESL